MIILTISKGSLAAGDKHAVRSVPGVAPPERIPRILGGVRDQVRLTNDLITTVNIVQVVNTRTTKQPIVGLPDSVDPGTFIDDIEVVVSGGRAPLLMLYGAGS